jgi:hypothetical protein
MEIASLAVMGHIIPAGYAPYYTLLWRSSTLYLSALVGFVCLALALMQDAGRVMRPTWNGPRICQPVVHQRTCWRRQALVGTARRFQKGD